MGISYGLDRDSGIQESRTDSVRHVQLGSTKRRNDNFFGLDGGLARAVSPFIAFTSADGTGQRMMRTDRYFPYEVAVAPDAHFGRSGTKWPAWMIPIRLPRVERTFYGILIAPER